MCQRVRPLPISPLFTCQEWLENIGKPKTNLTSDSGRTTIVRRVELSMEEAAAPEQKTVRIPFGRSTVIAKVLPL